MCVLSKKVPIQKSLETYHMDLVISEVDIEEIQTLNWLTPDKDI